MSIKMITEAFKLFEESALTAAQKLVLLALADHANDEDQLCWPSLQHLQKKTGLGKNTVWQSIDALVEKGFVTRVKKGSNGPIPEATLYRVNLGQLPTYLGQKQDDPRSKYGTRLGRGSTPNRNINHNRTSEKIKKITLPPWSDNQAFVDLGSEVGLRPNPGEDWNAFKNRVKYKVNGE